MKKSMLTMAKAICMTFALSTVAFAAETATVVGVAEKTADLSTLVTAIKAAGLVDTLNGAGPFTVFAPTNEAFNKLPAGELDKLLKDKAKLAKVLTYHVVPGNVTAADIKNGDVKTVEGQNVKLDKSDKGVFVNNAQVTKADIKASNGVIHEINEVLLPPAK